MPMRHRADFKEALPTLRRLKNAEDQANTKIGGKALPRIGGTGKIPGGIPNLSITATMDPVLIDWGNPRNSNWANYSWNDSQN